MLKHNRSKVPITKFLGGYTIFYFVSMYITVWEVQEFFGNDYWIVILTGNHDVHSSVKQEVSGQYIPIFSNIWELTEHKESCFLAFSAQQANIYLFKFCNKNTTKNVKYVQG